MNDTTDLMNSALAAIVALGSFGLADDAVAPYRKDSEKSYSLTKKETQTSNR